MEAVIHTDLTQSYDPAKTYWIRLGTGVPVGAALGNQVCDIEANARVLPFGALNRAVLIAHINRWDLDLATLFPLVITEAGIAWSNSPVDPKNDLVAYTLGIPYGSAAIFAPNPELTPEKRACVTFILDTP